jgi:deoxycytidine triphosphate deaminase
MAKKTVITPSVTLVGSILTRDEIISHGIIVFDNLKDNDPECFDNTSYNLRLGEKYYKPKIDKVNIIGEVACAEEYPGCPYHKQELDGVIGDCNLNNRVLVIKPYTSVVISTLERLNLPNNVVGRFDLKIRWALQGLILQVGTQIAPGYTGRLFGLLHNLSNKDICIPMKIGILDVEFSYTYKSVTSQKYDETYNTIEGFLKNRPPIVGTLEAFLEDIKKEKQVMQSMRIESQELKTEIATTLEKYKNEVIQRKENADSKNIQKLTFIIGIFFSLLFLSLTIVVPITITKLTVDKDDYPFQKVYEMENENKNKYLKMDSLLDKNKQTSDTLILLRKRINELEKKSGKKN